MIAEARAQLATVLAGVRGVAAHPHPTERTQLPAAMVMGLELEPGSMTSWDLLFEVRVFVAQTHRDRLAALDRLVDPDDETSLVAAIDADTSGPYSLEVAKVGEYRDDQLAGVDVWAATVTVGVLAAEG